MRVLFWCTLVCMYKFIFILALVVLGALSFSWYQNDFNNQNNREFINITLNNEDVKAEIVRSFAAKTLGLSGRDGLAPNTGMLFVFTETRNPEIWMKDMKFAIDIIFISKEGVVVAIFENATPESYFENPPKIFKTLEGSRYVLEVPAGTVQDARLRVGMTIDELISFE
jgi:uncharacterized membrane protein (UPF0127 family)